MKKLIVFVSLILTVSLLFGCSATVVDIDEEAVATDTKDNVDIDSQNDEPRSSIVVDDDIYTDKNEFDSGAVAEVYITAPEIVAEEYGENTDMLNQLIDINVDTVKNEYLLDVAMGENAEGANSSSRMLTYEIYSAEDGIVSILLKIVSQSGSANPATVYRAINYNLSEGKVINLADYIPDSKISNVKALIIEQMSKTPEKYYSVEANALDNIDFQNTFLIKDENVFIYFEEYVIAPRGAGMQMFEINLNDIA